MIILNENTTGMTLILELGNWVVEAKETYSKRDLYRYDFDIGAWKLGSGLVTDTGLLLQVVAPNSFEVCAQHLWV